MCGIGGFLGRFDPAVLDRMNAVQAYRGPDDAGVLHLQGPGLGFAHRRLSIIDVSNRGHQPMWDVTGTVAIVFNGEIFNYRELKRGLEADGFAFANDTDTEVLLNLYLRDGEGMLSQLNGMFAFALWDGRDQSLLLARDGLGVKPLYYARRPEGIVFASELKTVLAEPSIPREIEPLALNRHLSTLWCPAPLTLMKGVLKLEPGHFLKLKGQGDIVRHEQFYDLPYDQAIVPVTEAQATLHVREALQTAVQRQMVADVPVGAFLSGGLDSSAVVAFARQETAHRLQCFTIAFGNDAFQKEGFAADLPYAQTVARHLDVDLHAVTVDAAMAERLGDMIWHLDEPLADLAPLNVLFISQLAREHGIKVLLSGAGGDDIFTGYRRHHALMLESAWAWLPRPARQLLHVGTGLLPDSVPSLRRIKKAFQYADQDADGRLTGYFRWLETGTLESLYHPDFRARMADAFRADQPLDKLLAQLPAGTHPLNRMLYLEGKAFLVDHNLLYTDKMSMAASLEVRVPLLDPDLVALAARLPVDFKQRGANGKWIFKQAMRGILPDAVIDRPKTGFGAPLRQWLLKELNPLLRELLSPASLNARSLFDADAVQRLIADNASGRVDAAYPLFSLMCVELWCRRFIDQSASP